MRTCATRPLFLDQAQALARHKGSLSLANNASSADLAESPI